MLIPITATTVLNTSEAECTASEIIAPECPKIPANNFSNDKTRFPAIVTPDTLITIFFDFSSESCSNCSASIFISSFFCKADICNPLRYLLINAITSQPVTVGLVQSIFCFIGRSYKIKKKAPVEQ